MRITLGAISALTWLVLAARVDAGPLAASSWPDHGFHQNPWRPWKGPVPMRVRQEPQEEQARLPPPSSDRPAHRETAIKRLPLVFGPAARVARREFPDTAAALSSVATPPESMTRPATAASRGSLSGRVRAVQPLAGPALIPPSSAAGVAPRQSDSPASAMDHRRRATGQLRLPPVEGPSTRR
jgi:hypothetical protein